MARNVKLLIRELLQRSSQISSGEVAAAAGISRQAAHRHLRQMVDEGVLRRVGAGRGAHYRLAGVREEGEPQAQETFPREGLEEDRVWEHLREHSSLAELEGDSVAVFRYAMTELVNNAIDHSESAEVQVMVSADLDSMSFEVRDSGIGALERIRTALGLDSSLEALEELSKGKVTSDPENHTGEGIFFSSKLADLFELESSGLRWTVDNRRHDMSVASASYDPGTRVRFEARRSTPRTLREVFDEYTDDFEFSKTRVVVRLFELGVRFVSRSEAKRLLRGLDRFREVVLDFKGVEEVGQGFADEIFRVWAARHPEIQLTPVDVCEPVTFMIERAKRT